VGLSRATTESTWCKRVARRPDQLRVGAGRTDRCLATRAARRLGRVHPSHRQRIFAFHACTGPPSSCRPDCATQGRVLSRLHHGQGTEDSKSIPATRVDPTWWQRARADTLRYFVLREYSLGGDGDFSYEALFQRHESDLGNDLGTWSIAPCRWRARFPTGSMRPTRSGYSAGDPLSEEELLLRTAG